MNTDPNSSAVISARLQQLAMRFVQRCLDEFAVMHECAAQIRGDAQSATDANDIDLAPLRQLEHYAHKIHGTAASFGFATLSERGGVVERLAERLLQSEARLDKEACDALDSSLARLSGEIHTIAVTHGLK